MNAEPFTSKMITEDRIVDLISSKKDNVIRELIQVMNSSKMIPDKLEFYKAITEREKMGSFAIGEGVAISHATLSSLTRFVMTLGRKPEGIEFEAADGQPVQMVIMVGAPENQSDELLKFLAKLVLMMKNSKLRKKFLEASKKEIVNLLKDVIV